MLSLSTSSHPRHIAYDMALCSRTSKGLDLDLTVVRRLQVRSDW